MRKLGLSAKNAIFASNIIYLITSLRRSDSDCGNPQHSFPFNIIYFNKMRKKRQIFLYESV